MGEKSKKKKSEVIKNNDNKKENEKNNKKDDKKSPKGKFSEINKNKVANLILGATLLFAIGFFAGQQDFFNKEKKNYIELKEAKEKVRGFIEGNLVQEGTEIKVTEAKEERGLYKIKISLEDQEIETYITKDGQDFFPQAMNIEEIEEQTKAMVEGEQAAQKEIPKQDKPKVEAFVMSYCPYGTQIQKGLLPVAKLLKDKIDFDFKFVDYAMHEKEEIDENLIQYCMNEADQNKYYEYLDCFLVDGDNSGCFAKSGFNKNQIDQCVAKTDAEYKITETYNNKENWGGQFPPFNVQKEDNQKYEVKGSPTLVVNGVEALSSRDSQSLLTTICDSFSEAPEECQQQLSSEAAVPGFGEGVATSNAAADCAE
jgi:hypothetical protein